MSQDYTIPTLSQQFTAKLGLTDEDFEVFQDLTQDGFSEDKAITLIQEYKDSLHHKPLPFTYPRTVTPGCPFYCNESPMLMASSPLEILTFKPVALQGKRWD